MATLHLRDAFLHLSQHSVDSVQNGKVFTNWDYYMHVDRPIEKELMEKMDEIDAAGGGIVLLVGSAGDGKSHLISRIKQMSDWGDDSFYNDATASSSPRKSAIDTLKEALVDFKDVNLRNTSRKLVLAINLGKLNALIEDDEFKESYKGICNATIPIFDDDDSTPPIDTNRIKVIVFTDEQLFEFHASNGDCPVESTFLSQIMEKIVKSGDDNPFYTAYKKDLQEGVNPLDPILINYKLLTIPAVRNTIEKTIIEAIVRFKLNITPREFFDFLFSIVVYPHYDIYKESSDFFESLLPTLLYSGGENILQRATNKLDPLKQSSTEHDNQLSVLFTSYDIPPYYLPADITLPQEMIDRTNKFYSNNGEDIERTTKFVFRLKHLLDYHSESKVYLAYIDLLKGIFKQTPQKMQEIYDMVAQSIPRHFGSYYYKKDMIPLNIQGGEYRLFANLHMTPQPIHPYYSADKPYHFLLRFDMGWKVNDKTIPLHMDYQLYSYLTELRNGRLSLSYENEKVFSFGKFIRSLIEECGCAQDITVVRANDPEIQLSETTFGNIQLQ